VRRLCMLRPGLPMTDVVQNFTACCKQTRITTRLNHLVLFVSTRDADTSVGAWPKAKKATCRGIIGINMGEAKMRK
jgi:hypothetical protein